MLLSAGVLAMSSVLTNAGYLALLAFGFGFVIFWHELGHFLAAKWAGVRVEQFAVGFMQALFSWRKGLGFRIGSSQKEYKQRIYAHLGKTYDEKEGVETISDLEMRQAGEAIGLGETEYRLNWLPLGGYVKMLGQDDLRPNSEADDPKAYNRQSIGKRMVIVSAGVIMNVFLAAIGFMILFTMGFNVPPTIVGSVDPGSPAQLAGVQVGDRILQLDGKELHNDYTKLGLNAALSASDQDIPIVVERTMPDGSKKELPLTIKPVKADQGGMKLVSLGVGATFNLAGPAVKDEADNNTGIKEMDKVVHSNSLIVKPGDTITAVNDKPVTISDYPVLDAAMQQGEPVMLTIKGKDGQTRQAQLIPNFASSFGQNEFDILGLVPRQQFISVGLNSPLLGKVFPGDVLLSVAGEASATDAKVLPTFSELSAFINAQANEKKRVRITVLRGDQKITTEPVAPIAIRRGVYGIGVGLAADETAATAAKVLDGSPAAAAGIPNRATITTVNDKPVQNWRQVHTVIRQSLADNAETSSVTLKLNTEGGEEKSVTLNLGKPEMAAIRNVRYNAGSHGMGLEVMKQERIASGIGEATKWGVIETRDFILQFYVTLKRMATGDVSPTNLMGPVGIFQTGTTIASRGPDWLIWFLSMISANLAVVNFLPIPIVDGGLFAFLLIEKAKGKPASPKTQAVAQYIGLVLLLGIFVFVTWQDIANFAFR